MTPEAQNRPSDHQTGTVGTEGPARPVGTLPPPAAVGPAQGPAPALVVRDTRLDDADAEEEQRDTRLDLLLMQLDVMVKVRSFNVQDLLSLETGSVLETVHEHVQDVPVRSGGALLGWAEFEVLDQQLAVRVTRLA